MSDDRLPVLQLREAGTTTEIDALRRALQSPSTSDMRVLAEEAAARAWKVAADAAAPHRT